MSDESVQLALAGYIDEATDLRFASEFPAAQASPQQFMEFLVDVRQRLDRLEELLLATARIRAAAQRKKAVANALASEAWDRASQKLRSGRRQDDYLGAKERYADCNLESFTEQRAARAADALFALADEAYDYLKTAHRGLDGVRHDVISIVRSFSFESNLER